MCSSNNPLYSEDKIKISKAFVVYLCQTYIEKVGRTLLLLILSVTNIDIEKKMGGIKLLLVVVMKKTNTRE